MSYPIRPITPDEVVPFFEARAAGFGEAFDPSRLEHTLAYADLGRTLSAWDGDQVVGTASSWAFSMSVPGGELPCAGVTWVAVRPTHRRHGILTGLMRRQLEDTRDRGEPIAMLWASESQIYGRFGYGLTAEGIEHLTIDRTRTELVAGVRPSGRTRQVSVAHALETWPAVWERVRRETPAMHHRTPAWWQRRVLRQPESSPEGYGPSFYVNYEEQGEVLGYLRYRVREKWVNGGAANDLSVVELLAATDAAYTALWEFVFGIDLVGTILADWRKVDEPLFYMLADSRRLLRRPTDTVFCRIVDPVAALSGRRYMTEGALVLEVTDPFCEWVAGRYLLEGGPTGATCSPTTREPDITLGATELGAIYFGQTRPTPLLRAGRLCGPDDAVRRLESMLAWPVAPWAPEIW